MAKTSWLRVAASELGLALALSGAASATPQDDGEPAPRAVIAIPTEGAYHFGAEKVRREDLPQRLVDTLRGAPPEQQYVDLKVGASVRYGAVRDALMIVRE